MKGISVLALVFFTGFVLAPSPQAQAQVGQKPEIITFDVPGAGTGAGQGTFPGGIDDRGAIVGFYVDAGNVNHGFLRDPDGIITTFDAPGAGTGAGQGTVPQQSNPAGAITGMYMDANCLYHGFLRERDGTMTTFEVPGASTVGGACATSIWWLVMKGTSAQNITAAGAISGNYTDPEGVGHIFVRAPDGSFTTVDASGAGTGEVQSTWTAGPNDLNPAGAVIGWSVDSANALHGLFRNANGAVTTFDVPGAGTGAIQGTVPLSLNPEKALTGFYLDGNSVFHAFLRSPHGEITKFDVPGSGSGLFQGTYAANINPAGEVTGYYTDTNNVNHGFVRAAGGKLTTFDVLGAGASPYQGTSAYCNNAAGVIVGVSVDANYVSHGFVRGEVNFGRHEHFMAFQASGRPKMTANPTFHAQVRHDNSEKIWELGTYPGGTWFGSGNLNDLGVIVGIGDVPDSNGILSDHTLAIPLFGPHAGEWIDFKPPNGQQPTGGEEPINAIADSGLVASSYVGEDGQEHAVAWTRASDAIELGTLADTGNPQYANHNSSMAMTTNKLGTLIAGRSGVNGNLNVGFDTPVVWTPKYDWANGGFVTKWTIHELDTAGYPGFTWLIWGVNDLGQVDGVGGNGQTEIGALWNPRPDGKGWNLTALTSASGYAWMDPYGINDKGEIVGVISPDGSAILPVFWKPLDRSRTNYSSGIQLPMPGDAFVSCWAVGINNLGDMVGDCWNASYTIDLPTRWTTKNPAFSELIDFPANWGFSWGINDNRIAVLTYTGGQKCSSGIPWTATCGGAAQLH